MGLHLFCTQLLAARVKEAAKQIHYFQGICLTHLFSSSINNCSSNYLWMKINGMCFTQSYFSVELSIIMRPVIINHPTSFRCYLFYLRSNNFHLNKALRALFSLGLSFSFKSNSLIYFIGWAIYFSTSLLIGPNN